MAYTTTDYPAITGYQSSLATKLTGIFEEYKATKIAESVWKTIFDVSDSKDFADQNLILHGTTGIQKVAQGQDLPLVSSEEWDTIVYTQAKYGGFASITDEMRRFDQYDKMKSVVKSITEDAFDKIDQSMADVLLNGWSTSYTDVYGATVASVWPDGKALFNAAHTNGTTSSTYTNIMNDGTNSNPSLSRVAFVKEIATAAKYTDPNGIHRPIRLDTLVVWPDLADEADRIVNSQQMSGTANNDRNWPAGGVKSLSVKVWDRLGTNSAGTDTSAYYFMLNMDKGKETLKARFAKRPSLDAPEIYYKNKNWDYSLFFYYYLGLGFAPYVRGSTWANA